MTVASAAAVHESRDFPEETDDPAKDVNGPSHGRIQEEERTEAEGGQQGVPKDGEEAQASHEQDVSVDTRRLLS